MGLFDRSRPPRAVAVRLHGAEAWAFDWDGTLIDSIGRTLATYRQLLGEFGIAFDEVAFRANYAPDWRRIYRRVGLAELDWPKADKRWVELYETEVAGLVDGAAASLTELRAAGVRVALVTAGHRARVELEMRANGVDGLFDAAIFGDEVPHQKPDPAPLQLASKYLHVAPTALVLVGDASDDMTMARRAGVTAVGVLTGAADGRGLRRGGAHWVAPSVVSAVDAAGHVGAVPVQV
ncbi:MAG: HAD family hydrolase [Candidatus Limnocylindrales bacterium]